ncbi:potassium channel family protein [Williamsia maris]|uniref:potassium channel family protein n=1 Tax=Williamsia maris TaxID=72806 RepID=UPI0020A41936|nr:potassium channel family protein [Williamsia maris]
MLDRSNFLVAWDKRLEWPLAAVAAAFLAAYSVQVLAQPSGIERAVLSAVVAAAWSAFAIDYVVRLAVAPDKGRWFVRHLLDLAVVALPLLRPLRLLRLVILFGALQKAVGGAIRGRVVIYTAASAVLLIYVSSLAILEAERPRPDAAIKTFGDAVWWSITTVTTVGYGDYAPVTITGRIIAALLMIGGISLIGIVTATLASWIVQRVAQEDVANQVATKQQIRDLHDELAELRNAITRSQTVRAEGFEPPTAGV